MTKVTASDQVVLLLQAQLTRLAKEREKTRSRKVSKPPAPGPLARMRKLAAIDGLSDEDHGRALVRSVLVNQFGESIGTDPRFEAMADEVLRIISATEEGRSLLADAFDRLTS